MKITLSTLELFVSDLRLSFLDAWPTVFSASNALLNEPFSSFSLESVSYKYCTMHKQELLKFTTSEDYENITNQVLLKQQNQTYYNRNIYKSIFILRLKKTQPESAKSTRLKRSLSQVSWLSLIHLPINLMRFQVSWLSHVLEQVVHKISYNMPS